MCSVVGCDSWRHNVQRFSLPEDPERRQEWVQFLFEVNGQRLKESSWTDITICRKHFTDDCFVTGTFQLKPGAVPSLCIKAEPEEPEQSPQHVHPGKDLSGEAKECVPLIVGPHPPVPLLKDEKCQWHCRRSPWDIAEACQLRQSYNIQSLQELRAALIHPRGPATKELLYYLSDLTPSNG